MKKVKWWIWALLGVFLIIVFPKPCGPIIPSIVLDYKCFGIDASFISDMQNDVAKEDWCSGICTSKSKTKFKKIEIDKSEFSAGPMSGISDIFIDSLPALFLIIAMIVIIGFISQIQNQASKNKVTIIKGPRQ